VTVFPPFRESRLRFLILINSCLDIFDLRARNTFIDQDLGLLQALDERLAVYGWLTNTGVKILIIVDLAGRHVDGAGQKQNNTPVTGIRHSDLKPVRAGEIRCLQLLLICGWMISPGLQSTANRIYRTTPESVLQPGGPEWELASRNNE
jgi:hypothetical protein